MAEELSSETKIYVKGEIDKLSKEFKQDLKEAQSKATKTFTAVALIIGLLASMGVSKLAKDYANEALSNTAIKTIETNANVLYNKMIGYEKDANDISSKLKTYDERANKNGYAWIGDILFQWGTVPNSDVAENYKFPIPFPIECFSVVPNVKRVGGRSSAIHISTWTNDKFSINRDNGIDGWFDINYIAIGH